MMTHKTETIFCKSITALEFQEDSRCTGSKHNVKSYKCNPLTNVQKIVVE